jgi:hypothetical protein
MWPALAGLFDLPVAAPLAMSLTDVMADKQELWERMKTAHGLRDIPYSDVSSWPFGTAPSPGTTTSSPTVRSRGVTIFPQLVLPQCHPQLPR